MPFNVMEKFFILKPSDLSTTLYSYGQLLSLFNFTNKCFSREPQHRESNVGEEMRNSEKESRSR